MYDQQSFDVVLGQLVHETSTHDIHSEEFATAAKNLRLFSEVRPLIPEPEPVPDVIPEMTRWEKAKATVAAVWDNETTRVFLKTAGSLGGVGLVVYTTVHKDHVIERNALAQANQRPSN